MDKEDIFFKEENSFVVKIAKKFIFYFKLTSLLLANKVEKKTKIKLPAKHLIIPEMNKIKTKL